MSADPVTAEQAQAAKDLWNDAGAYPLLIALARVLPEPVKQQLGEAHGNADPDCCNAHSEGQSCCVDILLDDPEKYAPERIAEAQDVLRRWRKQQ